MIIPSRETAESVQPPAGYCLAPPEMASFREARKLDVAVNGRGGCWIKEVGWPDENHDRTYLTIRSNSTGLLVGLGVLGIEHEDDTKSGDLSYLMVHPDHRHKSIGKFLISARIELADSLGLQGLTTSLASTNNLRGFYLEQGFEELSKDWLVRSNQQDSQSQTLALAY